MGLATIGRKPLLICAMTLPSMAAVRYYSINYTGRATALYLFIMTITHENILKILDVHYSQFSKAFIGFMAQQRPVYKDRILEEDLFSPDDIREDHPNIPDETLTELTEVAGLMKQFDCGYFRIIYT